MEQTPLNALLLARHFGSEDRTTARARSVRLATGPNRVRRLAHRLRLSWYVAARRSRDAQ